MPGIREELGRLARARATKAEAMLAHKALHGGPTQTTYKGEGTMDRKEQLVRAAKARAAIIAALGNAEEAWAPDRIHPLVEDLGYSRKGLLVLLATMASQGLLQQVEIEHPSYSYGYRQAAGVKAAEPRKKRTATTEKELDVTANADGSLTLKFRGLRLRLSVEGK